MTTVSNSLKIVFAGTSIFAVHHLDALLSSGYKIIGVFTQPDRPAGRGKKIMSSPVKILAKKKGIPVFQPNSLHSMESQQIIADLNADIILVVAYGLILPKAILDMPRFGCVNVHASLLPRWRGAAPIQRSLLAGDAETGITIIQMDIGIDTGNILYSLPCLITKSDTSVSLFEKLSKLGKKGLLDTLPKIVNGEVTPKVQDESLVTYAEKLSKNESRIDWSLPATYIERCVRAFNPWPGSWVRINGRSIKIWQASAIPITVKEEPGTIIRAKKKGIQVATVNGVLNIEFLQPEGKALMSAQDILNSSREHFLPGKCFT